MFRIRTIRRALIGLALAAVVAAFSALQPSAARGAQGGQRILPKITVCTMAEPKVRATVEVVIRNAADFCELVSQALASEVFHAPVLVTPGRLWHYAGATLSCSLRYRSTQHRATIHNSVAACRWFKQRAKGWHVVIFAAGI